MAALIFAIVLMLEETVKSKVVKGPLFIGDGGMQRGGNINFQKGVPLSLH